MNTGGLINEDAWVLGDMSMLLSKREYKMKTIGNGRIASLYDTQDKKSPLMYPNQDNGLISFQKFSFYKNKAGEWVMIR